MCNCQLKPKQLPLNFKELNVLTPCVNNLVTNKLVWGPNNRDKCIIYWVDHINVVQSQENAIQSHQI